MNVKEIICRQNSASISHQVSLASLLDVSAGNCKRSGGQIRNDYKSDGDAQQIINGHGATVTLCAYPTRTEDKGCETQGFITVFTTAHDWTFPELAAISPQPHILFL
jgi:hypothetical protein